MNTNKIVVTEKIYVEPNQLNSNLINYIKNKIKQQIGTCNPEYGYILKIYDDIEISKNRISSNDSGSFFQVKFTINALKPKKGDMYEGKVCMIFSEGIFVDVLEKIKILIPKDVLKGFEYNKNGNYFEGLGKIKLEDLLYVEINIVKYDKGKFSCIGSLKSS
jgi:DNA-directed RNA polymerase subunit E'/Rpb7